jgi:multidrug resistance efflux pump
MTAQALTAGARIEQARADLEAAELQLSYTTIVAPVDRKVTDKTVSSAGSSRRDRAC